MRSSLPEFSEPHCTERFFMANKNPFRARTADDINRIVGDHPLSWLYATDSQGPFSTAVPVRPHLVDGRLCSLVGHIPRNGRLAAALAHSSEVLILIQGPHGYVSPSWFSNRAQAPTWNYIAVQFVADIALKDDAVFLDAHLRDLTLSMEQHHSSPWGVDELGTRLPQLVSRIIAFEATIRASDARFKLGQDESDATFQEIIDALEKADNEQLVAWMRACNAER